MWGRAAAASSLFTVTRTSSEPARAREATCSTVEATSAVSVLVMDCTTTGASDPTRTLPIVQVTVLRRWMEAMGISSLAERAGRAGVLRPQSATIVLTTDYNHQDEGPAVRRS